MLPHILFYTDWIKENKGGSTNAFVIRIRPKYKHDAGIYEHELTHVKQWWRTAGLHSLFYIFSKKYRLKSEVEAYRKQLEYTPEGLSQYADWLSDPKMYALTLSKNEAVGRLT
jgi:hypothetical protein